VLYSLDFEEQLPGACTMIYGPHFGWPAGSALPYLGKTFAELSQTNLAAFIDESI